MEINDELIQRIWEKGIVKEGFDPNVARQDACGAWILRNQFANTDSLYGWEIDHVYPLALGGGDEEDNLRPMQWKNNRSKGSDYPSYSSSIKGFGNENKEAEGHYTVNEGLRRKLSQLYHIL